ncbi:MAG: YhgE/Pip domain-containing protein [Peptococcaceae bacterium]|nr:YhgE/Pip domain-containing protein [Candidatus Syntrophopropionicum ammoniitolerans]
MSVLLTVVFILTAVIPVLAADWPRQKEEVVYGVLGGDGQVESIYVVNSFPGGLITDFGDYSVVSNMTSAEKLTQRDDQVTINTTADRFYYQGTLATKALPWNITIGYELDGQEIAVDQLAGRSGPLAITMSIEQNDAVNPVFYENYMLQVSLTLDTDKCRDIAAPNATLASAGKDKVVTHTVLPGKGAQITVQANVRDFTMKGVEIVGMPFSLPIEMPDTGELTAGMTSLAGAVGALQDGVEKLSMGLAETDQGAHKLTGGAADFARGLAALSDNSREMLAGSAQIERALTSVGKALDEGKGDFARIDFTVLPGGSRQLAAGLDDIYATMQTLKNGYADAYAALDSAIGAIPYKDIDPAPLYAAVHGDEALTATLDQLVEYYGVAQRTKGTYGAVREGFAAVDGNMDTMCGTIGALAGPLGEMAEVMEQSLEMMDFMTQIGQFQKGLSQLANNYGQFHAGLEQYMCSVEQLATGYDAVEGGIRSLAGGIGALNRGAEDLSAGASRLNEAVSNLPGKVQAEIDQLAGSYDKSDFAPVSFVSDKNTAVQAVQFVIKTAPIESPQVEPSAVAIAEKLAFWQKILRLLGLH